MERNWKGLKDLIALNRRNFIKLLIGGAVGTTVTPLPWKLTDDIAIWTQNWPWVPVPPVGAFAHVKSVCTLCPGGCGIQVRKVSATLLNGVTVELIGLYRGETVNDLVFWKPDGSSFSDSETQKYRERVALPKWQNKDFRFEYGFMIRFGPLDDLNTEVFVKQGQRMSYRYPRSERWLSRSRR